MDNTVQVRREGAVTVVRLHRPEVRNAVDAATALALYEAFLAFDEDPGARVAVFCGAAVAGGMELALWCDMRVMEEDAYFGVPLIDGGTVRLPRLIGMGHAMDLILTGRKVEAAEALRMGLCNRVVPGGQGLEVALQTAQRLAALPQTTMLADRLSAYAQWDLPLPQALHQEWEWGKGCIAEGLEGAARIAAGDGRGGAG